MKNLLRACLLALLAGLSQLGSAAYEGPDDAAAQRWQSTSLMAACYPANTQLTWAQFQTCMATMGKPSYKYADNVCHDFPTAEPTIATVGVAVQVFNGAACSVSNYGSVASGVFACGTNRAFIALGPAGTSNRCVSTCYALIGQQVSGSVAIEDPAATVPSACLQTASNGVCEVEVSDTANFTYGGQLYRGGTWSYVGHRCTEDPTDAPTVGASTAAPIGTNTGATTVSGAVSLGGADAGKLAEIATNTAGTNGAVAAASSSLGGKLDSLGDKVDQVSGGQCGGPGQPVCSTAGDEGNTADSTTATVDNLEGLRIDAQAGLQGRLDLLTLASMPTFGDRFSFSLASFLGGSSACYMDVPFNKLGVENLRISVCAWGDYAHDFFYWVMGVWTAYGLWSLLYVRRGV